MRGVVWVELVAKNSNKSWVKGDIFVGKANISRLIRLESHKWKTTALSEIPSWCICGVTK